MFEKPRLTEYILARLISIAIFIIIAATIFASIIFPQRSIALDILLLSIALSILIYSVHLMMQRLEFKLNRINRHLVELTDTSDPHNHTFFFTREFENINQNLIEILKQARKRYSDKQKYNVKLKLKNQQRSDILAAIAHEFRNPISSIMGYAQTLNQDEAIPPALQKKFLQKIYNNSTKIEEILSRLLLWNHFESGALQLQRNNFDLVKLTRDVVTQLQEKYKEREVAIESQGSVSMIADRTMIEIVLKNLIENALKYSKDKVLVLIDKERIAIIDQGIGISQHKIKKVTKKFYRTGEHDWDNSMGLGLSIVKNILKLHGWKLQIE
ncbi:MAG: HAMP domain-containing histidine kinase, partial [Campylobacterales bacterium]|nr:HAMP domain-containing histidine kinase [Campylobacterales bacterium]